MGHSNGEATGNVGGEGASLPQDDAQRLAAIRDFDIDAYLASLPWSADTDGTLKTFVNGNVRSVLYRVKKMAGWTDET